MTREIKECMLESHLADRASAAKKHNKSRLMAHFVSSSVAFKHTLQPSFKLLHLPSMQRLYVTSCSDLYSGNKHSSDTGLYVAKISKGITSERAYLWSPALALPATERSERPIIALRRPGWRGSAG